MRQSFWTNVVTLIGFWLILQLLFTMLGGVIGFCLHIVLPMLLVLVLVRGINRRQQKRTKALPSSTSQRE